MAARPERYVFIDESGDSETCLTLSALSFIGPIADAEEQATGLVHACREMFGLPGDFELHGVALLRDARLKDFQREFLFRHGLEVAAQLASVRVFTVHWDWSPDPPRTPGDPKAHRLRRLYNVLLTWIAGTATREDWSVAEIVIDQLSQAKHVDREHAEWAAITESDRILVSPRFEPSIDTPLLQLADLVAHSAFLSVRRRDRASTPATPTKRSKRRRDTPLWTEATSEDPARHWYKKALSGRFPEECREWGIRKLRGPGAEDH